MSDVPLRAAIIGTGRIGSALERDPLRSKPHTHAGWYVTHPHILLSGGADTNVDRLGAFGADWGLSADRLFDSYLEMLAALAPDLVSVCAYAPERVAMAQAALAAGARGLWLEKAVATSLASAQALRAAAARAGASVVVNHPRSQDPHYRAVRRLIDEGTLGPLESVHVLFSGHLIHTGTHAWEVLESWCGPWTEVRCWPDAAGESNTMASGSRPHAAVDEGPGARDGAEDIGGRVHIRFANGVDAFVSGGRKSYFIFQFDLVFANGRVHLGNDVNQVLVTGPSPRYSGFVELTEASWRLDGPGGPLLVEVLADAVRRGVSDLSSLDAAIRALALGIATVQASAAPGVAITPATLDSSFVVGSV
ncbi:MAG: Gfo/Idh/MocA family oxidoreductase [Vicinamibacteraceae bacterium]